MGSGGDDDEAVEAALASSIRSPPPATTRLPPHPITAHGPRLSPFLSPCPPPTAPWFLVDSSRRLERHGCWFLGFFDAWILRELVRCSSLLGG
uniref:Uncharacterized protein n=1 Tax=Arundo donax TaxID=35708 RepID=A0A0A8ZBH4_ARUDO